MLPCSCVSNTPVYRSNATTYPWRVYQRDTVSRRPGLFLSIWYSEDSGRQGWCNSQLFKFSSCPWFIWGCYRGRSDEAVSSTNQRRRIYTTSLEGVVEEWNTFVDSLVSIDRSIPTGTREYNLRDWRKEKDVFNMLPFLLESTWYSMACRCITLAFKRRWMAHMLKNLVS